MGIRMRCTVGQPITFDDGAGLDISDLLFIEDQQTAIYSLRRRPTFGE